MLNVNTKKMGIFPLLLVIILAFSMIVLVACDNQEQAEAAPLTDDELMYFNGDLFFNGDDFNIRNQFLSSLYSKPGEIDLFELFYIGSGIDERITEDELKAVMTENNMTGTIEDLPCPCEKSSLSNMDKILTEHMGITLADTNDVGLDGFTYLSEHDAYYHLHGDTNYRTNISFSSGEREGNVIRLFYNDTFFGDGDKVLTLQEEEGKYLFVANQKVE
jgi:hypothetical protein